MKRIKMEVMILSEKYSEEKLKYKNDQKRIQAEKERDWLRNECLRLTKLTKQQNTTILEQENKIKLLEDKVEEYQNLVEQLRISREKELTANQLTLKNKIDFSDFNILKSKSNEIHKPYTEENNKNRKTCENTPWMVKAMELNFGCTSTPQIAPKNWKNTQSTIIQSQNDQIKKLKRINSTLRASQTIKVSEECEYKNLLIKCIEDVKKHIFSRKDPKIFEHHNKLDNNMMNFHDKK